MSSERTRRCCHLGGIVDRRDRTSGRRTGGEHLSRTRDGDPADRDDRDGGNRDRPAQSLDALYPIGIVLRRRGEHRPEPEVVGAAGACRTNLNEIVGRYADPQSLPDESARVGEWQIGLAEVDRIGSDDQRDIDPIVDDQRDPRAIADPTSHPRDPDQLVGVDPAIARLEPDLEGAGMSRERDREALVVAIEHRVETAKRPDRWPTVQNGSPQPTSAIAFMNRSSFEHAWIVGTMWRVSDWSFIR